MKRRTFIKTTTSAIATIPLFAIGGSNFCSCSSGSKKPNSKVNGVQLGCTTYSYGSMQDKSIPAVIEYLKYAGINSIELRNIAEAALGIPQMPRFPRPSENETLEEKQKRQEEIAKQRAEIAEKQRQWRLSLPMSKYEEMRKQFNDAGIKVHVSKFAPSAWSDEEIDYAFKAADILGSFGVSDELTEKNVPRLGPFAEKWNKLAIFHTHGQFGDPNFDIDKYLAMGPKNRLNLDIGHYYGVTGKHPGELIEKYHDKIPTIHVKDKTTPTADKQGVNMPFGQGNTPIADVLLLIKKNKWNIHCDIELEYPIPEDSNASEEVKKCIDYMRNILE